MYSENKASGGSQLRNKEGALHLARRDKNAEVFLTGGLMKIAVIQLKVGEDKRGNVRHASERIRHAAEEGAELIVLPEMFCCPYTNESFLKNAEPEGSLVSAEMARAAAESKVVLVAGSMPESCEGKIYNTSFVYDPQGVRIARHRKVHLFDINVEGGQKFCESDTFTRGDQCTVFDTPWGKIGLCICFDMRFPELSMHMALEGAQMIIAPAAFNMTTGPAHWELLFRQRAVDNQLFTVGCAPARDENGPYVSYANSIICGPWGNIITRADTTETTLYTEIDFRENDRIRRQLPLLSARIPEVY